MKEFFEAIFEARPPKEVLIVSILGILVGVAILSYGIYLILSI